MPEEKSKSKSRSKSSSKDKVSSKQHTSSSKTKLVEDSIISQNPPTLLKSVEDPCENCQQESSINFCPTCDLKLCIQCTNKIHSQIPAFSLHKILPAQSASLHRVQCNIHKNRAILYCETCQEFICPQCQESLHQGIQHQTITIQQAFNVKLNSIRSRISTEISPLKMKLNNVHENHGNNTFHQKRVRIDHPAAEQSRRTKNKQNPARFQLLSRKPQQHRKTRINDDNDVPGELQPIKPLSAGTRNAQNDRPDRGYRHRAAWRRRPGDRF